MDRRQFLAVSSASLAASPLLGRGAARAAEADRKLRVAVIGHTGRGNYGHGLDTVWSKSPELFEVVAVADADADGLRAAQSRLKIDAGFSDYVKMLAETKPDVVAVCPRHVDQHADMVLAAIEAGAKGVYVEKPMCRNPSEADAIVAGCEARNVKLAVAHRNRYNPTLPIIQKMIADGGLGKLLEVRCRGKEDERGGSLDLWVLGSHVINVAHFFCDRPTACTATLYDHATGQLVSRGDVRDGGDAVGPVAGNELHARFETKSGVPIFFDSVAKMGNKMAGFGLQLIGNEGLVDLRFDAPGFAHFVPGNPFLPSDKPRPWTPITSAGLGKPEPSPEQIAACADHTLAVRDLASAIRENRPPLCSAADGAMTIEMICATFESHRLGGNRVQLPIQTRENPLSLL